MNRVIPLHTTKQETVVEFKKHASIKGESA
jgi:hypothetical protein